MIGDEKQQRSQHDRHSPRPPRNYFARREQYRLLSLVFTLLLVVFLMFEAAKPANWQWMWQLDGADQRAGQTEEPNIDTRLPRQAVEPIPADVFLLSAESSDAANSQTARPNVLPGVVELDLSRLQDDTVFRGAESSIWYGMLRALNEVDSRTLNSDSIGNVGFTQLFRQTDQYRGRTVTVSGTVRRAFPLSAGQNDAGIESYWQCWLQPDGSPNPIVVYSLEMPDGFPQGMSVRERVNFTGIVYKRWAYAAQEGTRTAPLVLAKSPVWTQAAPTISKAPATVPDMLLVAIGALIAAALVTWLVYWRTRSKKRIGSVEVLACIVMTFWLGNVPLRAQQPNRDAPSAVQTVQEFLKLFDIDGEQLSLVATAASSDADDSQLLGEVQEATLRLFRSLRRCPNSILQRQAVAINELESPGQLQLGDAVRLRAQLQRVERVPVAADLRGRFEVAEFYRCHCTSPAADQSRSFTILAGKIPQRWAVLLASTAPDDPVRLRAFASQQITCTAVTLTANPAAKLALATDRIAWHPQSPDESFEVNADHVLLASHGLDIGQLDEVKPKGPLSPHDRAAFYQMLLAMGRIPSSELNQTARNVNVTELLQDTASHRGKLYEIAGTARRCIKVLVDDEQSGEFGLSSYYELVVFLDPDALVKVRSSESDAGKYFATYPVVVCVRSLPDGFPQGEEIHAAVQVVGSYLKLWAYPSKFMQEDGGKALQFSPLLIGNVPRLTPAAKTTDPLSGPGLAIAFAALLFLMSALVWWWRRGDEKFKQETLSRKYDLPSETKLDEQDFEDSAAPSLDDHSP